MSNNGAIQSSYALGSLFAKDVRNSTVWLSGFAGSNNGGSLRYCYSATALTAAGEAEVYGLTRIGGGALECCYLNGGTYSYGGHLYAYNTAANSFSSSAAGTAHHRRGSGKAAAVRLLPRRCHPLRRHGQLSLPCRGPQ